VKTRTGFVVLGGAGTIGRVVVRDLFASRSRHRILIADFNEAAARDFAKSFRSPRVRAAFADASKPGQLVRVLRGHAVVANCTQHDFNLHVMRAALAAHVHYLDLGGLFSWTRRQLKLRSQFQRAGLTAVLGMGCAPGIVNVMARWAADHFERIDRIRIRVAGATLGSGSRHDPLLRSSRRKEAQTPLTDEGHSPLASTALVFPYSAQTILEELTLRPWIFARGRFRRVSPRTGWELIDFGPPVGPQWVVRTRHSEVATLPLSLGAKGLKHCDFKVGFDRTFVREIVKRLRAGWTVRDFAALPKPAAVPDDYEITRLIVEGWRRQGRRLTPKTVTMDCHARAKPAWRACAGDVDTGCPASIVAQIIASDELHAPGVWPPELAVPVGRFLEELARRSLNVTVDGRAAWA
jgi:saccharopine dehydrogenase-like NADP-dependent oxidoreductase